MVNKEKLPALDGLRGWMALWVFVTHVVTMATLPLVKTQGLGIVLANGQYAVCVFILLSGFVISNSATSHTWRNFIIRRGFRLFPAYLVCLLGSVVTLDLSIDLIQSTPWHMERTADRLKYLLDSKENFWTHLGLHVFLLHGLVPDKLLSSTSYAFMGQAWSLSLEWQYYLIVGLLMMFSLKSKNIIFELLILGFLIFIAKFQTQPSFILMYLWLFFVGHLFWKHFDEKQFWRWPLYLGLSLLMRDKSYPIILFAGVVYSSYYKGAFSQWFESKLSLFLGQISYGFYCVHMLSIFVTGYCLLHVFNVESRWLYCGLLIISSLALAITLSMLLNKYIELPMIRYAKKITSKSKD
ncbi:MAG TPA: acyltransferase [Methylophilus sp.]|uniref:acyltransferase family protein n=1 Tax=Methylophilus sp. TaxID=29541 RepID=UPI002B7DF07C|nr:acyltransferase [Methylophilus sp.]HSH88043.1 acyltransferase [Methylophilus sp.]